MLIFSIRVVSSLISTPVVIPTLKKGPLVIKILNQIIVKSLIQIQNIMFRSIIITTLFASCRAVQCDLPNDMGEEPAVKRMRTDDKKVRHQLVSEWQKLFEACKTEPGNGVYFAKRECHWMCKVTDGKTGEFSSSSVTPKAFSQEAVQSAYNDAAKRKKQIERGEVQAKRKPQTCRSQHAAEEWDALVQQADLKAEKCITWHSSRKRWFISVSSGGYRCQVYVTPKACSVEAITASHEEAKQKLISIKESIALEASIGPNLVGKVGIVHAAVEDGYQIDFGSDGIKFVPARFCHAVDGITNPASAQTGPQMQNDLHREGEVIANSGGAQICENNIELCQGVRMAKGASVKISAGDDSSNAAIKCKGQFYLQLPKRKKCNPKVRKEKRSVEEWKDLVESTGLTDAAKHIYWSLTRKCWNVAIWSGGKNHAAVVTPTCFSVAGVKAAHEKAKQKLISIKESIAIKAALAIASSGEAQILENHASIAIGASVKISDCNDCKEDYPDLVGKVGIVHASLEDGYQIDFGSGEIKFVPARFCNVVDGISNPTPALTGEGEHVQDRVQRDLQIVPYVPPAVKHEMKSELIKNEPEVKIERSGIQEEVPTQLVGSSQHPVQQLVPYVPRTVKQETKSEGMKNETPVKIEGTIIKCEPVVEVEMKPEK